MRTHRTKQANLVGPAGPISMEDTLATELVQCATAGSTGIFSMVEMGLDASAGEHIRSVISENAVRRFWCGYQELMGVSAR